MNATDNDGTGNSAPISESSKERAVRALHSRVRKLVDDWGAAMDGHWDSLEATRLYDEFERIATSAEEGEQADISGPALQMTVYLCTFVDGNLQPSPAQRQKMTALIDELRAAAGGNPQRTSTGAGARAPAPNARIAFYLRPIEHESIALARLLGQQGYVVRPFVSVTEARVALELTTPDALVVDAAFLPELHVMVEAGEKARADTRSPPVCLVIGEVGDEALRQFAQRSGADDSIAGDDAVAIAARLEELVAAHRHQDYRVLVVEDDRAQALFCESVLKHRGMVTRTVATAGEVMDALAEFRPDLLLLDLYLPDANGIEVAQTIRARPEHVLLPIVFLSGEQDIDKRFDAIRMGGDSFINKPVRPRHLLGEIETRIRRARALSGRTGKRGERRGALVGRKVFMEELARVARDEEGIVGVTLFGAIDPGGVRERVGFELASEVSQQIATALAAEPGSMRPVCSYSEFAFLGVTRGSSTHAVAQNLSRLRERFSDREWNSSAVPARIEFATASIRLSGRDTAPEALVRELGALWDKAIAQDDPCAFALEAPATATLESAESRVLRTMLLRQLLSDSIVLEFQPLQSLHGEHTGQYEADVRLRAPKLRRPLELDAPAWRRLGRELGVIGSLDRQCLRHLLAHLRGRAVAPGLRACFHVSIESLLDSAFAPWLAAELTLHEIPANWLALEFEAAELAPELARAGAALDSLHLVGVRLSLAGLGSAPADQLLVKIPSFDMVKVLPPPGEAPAPGSWQTERGEIIKLALHYGKVVVATGVRNANELGALHRLGVHYTQSDAMAPKVAELPEGAG